MNAALGTVSAGGIGSPASDVTQSGGGPNAFVASHGIGNAGGVTLSKFSVEVLRLAHGAHRPRPGRIPASVGPIAMPIAMSNSIKTTCRSRLGVSVCFRLLTIAADVRKTLLQMLQSGVNLSPRHPIASLSPSDHSEKRMGSSAMKLLVARCLRSRETHHC